MGIWKRTGNIEHHRTAKRFGIEVPYEVEVPGVSWDADDDDDMYGYIYRHLPAYKSYTLQSEIFNERKIIVATTRSIVRFTDNYVVLPNDLDLTEKERELILLESITARRQLITGKDEMPKFQLELKEVGEEEPMKIGDYKEPLEFRGLASQLFNRSSITTMSGPITKIEGEHFIIASSDSHVFVAVRNGYIIANGRKRNGDAFLWINLLDTSYFEYRQIKGIDVDSLARQYAWAYKHRDIIEKQWDRNIVFYGPTYFTSPGWKLLLGKWSKFAF